MKPSLFEAMAIAMVATFHLQAKIIWRMLTGDLLVLERTEGMAFGCQNFPGCALREMRWFSTFSDVGPTFT